MASKLPFKFFARSFSTNSAIFQCSPFKLHKCLSPKQKLMISSDEMLKYYRQISRIRQMELKCDVIYKSGLMRGFCHLYDGQEAVAVGIEAALKPSDHIITAYRCHAQQLLRGDTLHNIFAEFMGRRTGSSKGKGGSMHLYMPQNNFYGGNGIVGAQVSVGGGIAFACKYKNTSQVCAALFGDGAANQGQVFETANMAALWRLPLIFVVENNRYGMGTDAQRSSFSAEFYARGDYVAGVRCDGQDVVSVRAAVEHAAEMCRAGKGPVFVEMMTYRYHGHSMSDPGKTYRTPDEVKAYRTNEDALKKCKEHILSQNWATEDELKAVVKEATAEVESAFLRAKQDEEPHQTEMFDGVFFNEHPEFIRAADIEKSFKKAVGAES